MFDIELQEKFTDPNINQPRWRESSQASKDISLRGTEMSSVAEELCLSESFQSRERSHALLRELAQVVRLHSQSAAGSSKASVDASGCTIPGSDKEFEENMSLVANVLLQVTRNHSLSKPSKSKRQPITVSLLQMHNELTSNPPYHYGGVTNPSTTFSDDKSASNDRNTIDTEVSDSLYRLRAIAPRNNAGKSSRMKSDNKASNGVRGVTFPNQREVTPIQSTAEFITRPVNPYVGCPHGSFTTPGQAPQTAMQVWRMNPRAAKELNDESREAAFHPVTSAGTPMDVECPRPVKPSNVEKRQLSSRGPRSKTGKNICPSNYSAFSECSGGESRSFNSAELRASGALDVSTK